MSAHYTAIVEINKVVKPEPVDLQSRRYTDTLTNVQKEVVEVARVVVRDTSIESLVEKVKAHLEIVDDK